MIVAGARGRRSQEIGEGFNWARMEPPGSTMDHPPPHHHSPRELRINTCTNYLSAPKGQIDGTVLPGVR